jgi:hypothetical protein
MDQREGNPTRGAKFSRCGRYRYVLWRAWSPGPALKVVNFVMLNPSTADAETDDATIRRCVGFAKAWGFGGITVTNLFAFKATDPADMKAAPEPVGPDNDVYVGHEAAVASMVVCAWGNHGAWAGRAEAVFRLLTARGVEPVAFRVTEAGQPNHPLRLPYTLYPQPLEYRDGKFAHKTVFGNAPCPSQS